MNYLSYTVFHNNISTSFILVFYLCTSYIMMYLGENIRYNHNTYHNVSCFFFLQIWQYRNNIHIFVYTTTREYNNVVFTVYYNNYSGTYYNMYIIY